MRGTYLPAWCGLCKSWMYSEDIMTHIGDYHGVGAIIVTSATTEEAMEAYDVGVGDRAIHPLSDVAKRRLEYYIANGPGEYPNDGYDVPKPWDDVVDIGANPCREQQSGRGV